MCSDLNYKLTLMGTEEGTPVRKPCLLSMGELMNALISAMGGQMEGKG